MYGLMLRLVYAGEILRENKLSITHIQILVCMCNICINYIK